MGRLVNGYWYEQRPPAVDARGAWHRGTTHFHGRVTADGASGHLAAPGRYHLFAALNCPWAHRTLIVRELKGLSDLISVSIAHFRRSDQGWWFPDGLDAMKLEYGFDPPRLHLHTVYTEANPHFTGGVTVPVLWDRYTRSIVSNESAEIIVMLNRAFDELGDAAVDLYPADRRHVIDDVNERVYRTVNNGVYRCGFARSQEAYEEAFGELFETLDVLESRLDAHRYLAGDSLTLADVRLFPTLVRFDPVYFSHFKCNLRRIADYANLSGYLRDLYQTPGFAKHVDIPLYKRGYYGNSPRLNPSGIIPVGPAIDHTAAHDRATRSYSGRTSLETT